MLLKNKTNQQPGNVVHGLPGGLSDGGHARGFPFSPQPGLGPGPQPAGLPTGDLISYNFASRKSFRILVRRAQPMSAVGSLSGDV